MGTFYEGLELSHAPFRPVCQIRVYVVVIGYCIRRAGITLHEGLAACVADYASIPYRTDTQRLKIVEYGSVPFRQLAAAPDAGEYLIDDIPHLLRLLNSDTVTAVATATLSDSAPPPNDGIVILSVTFAATSGEMPSASFPIIIRPSFGRSWA